MSQYSRGSEWRRWDLHIHTASSYDYKYKKDDSDIQLCVKLEENNIVACAITDHFLIDEERILNLQKLAPEITFFPAVELRTDKGDTNIHIILIFSEKINLHNLCEDFNVFKRQKAKNKEENERIYWDYGDIEEFSKQHDGIISIHAGRKTNGVDDRISNTLPHNQAVKTEYASTVNIFEMGQLRDFEEYEKYVFSSIGRKAMVICSDNHDATNYTTKEKLWIKADPNFNGLKQAVIEPDRVYVGDLPPTLDRVIKNKTKTIDKVGVTWTSDYTGNQGEWFKDVEINFNPEMSVIIGNKGSGKTAIAEIVGLLGNSKNTDDFVFLRSDKFKKKNLAKGFDATLSWYKGVHSNTKNLADTVNSSDNELVHFVPQNSFEKFCNESDQDFIKEINSVVFSRMRKENTLSFSSFEELINHEKSVIDDRKTEIGLKIDELSEKIKLLEEQRDNDYRETFVNNKKTLQIEFDEHQKIKLNEIHPPKEVNTPDYKANVEKLKGIDDEINSKKEILSVLNKKQSNFLLTEKKLKGFVQSIDEKIEILSEELSEFDINISEVFKYSLDLKAVENFSKQVEYEILEVKKALLPDNECTPEERLISLMSKKKDITEIIERFNVENQGKLSEYQKYLIDSKEWMDRNKEISEKLKSINSKIDYIGDCKNSMLVTDIVNLTNERFDKVRQLYQCFKDEQQIYDKFKEPITIFLGQYQEHLHNFQTEINSGIFVKDDFSNSFVENYIDSSVNGEFKGVDGTKKIKELVSAYDFTDEEDLIDFMKKIADDLVKGFEEKCFHKAFKKGKYGAFFKDFYKLSFLDARYSLQLFGKELNSLSPGERGSLLLVFYLLLDARDTPLILDQPEDNLDNQSVAEILVPFIRSAKKRRQIIIITHNSNLAVVSDAEQVIRVKMDKQSGNTFTFESGSLESDIIEDVVNVLEGTIASFNIRKSKYPN